MLDTLTPHAFDARLSGLLRGHAMIVSPTGRVPASEYEFETLVDGETLAWTAYFEVEFEQDGDEWMRWSHAVLSVTLKGAWCEDASGNLFCGNRDEVLAIVGADEVARWEAYVTDRESGE